MISILEVQFVGEAVEEVEHYIAYKLQNFISDVGGLLGLFMGGSLISVVEIFYFLVKSIINFFKPKSSVRQNVIQRNIDVSCIDENPLINDLKGHVEKMSKKIDNLSGQLRNVNLRLEFVENFNLSIENSCNNHGLGKKSNP